MGDGAFYHIEELLNDTIRIYSHTGDTYLAQPHENGPMPGEDQAESRLYSDGDTWYAKVRTPPTDSDTDFAVQNVAAQIEIRYDTDLDIGYERSRQLDDGENITVEDSPFTLSYNFSEEIDGPASRAAEMVGTASMLTWSGLGKGVHWGFIGSLLGSGSGTIVLGPLGAMGGAKAGWVIGGTLGGLVGSKKTAQQYWRYRKGMAIDSDESDSTIRDKISFWNMNGREGPAYTDIDRKKDLFHGINTRQELELRHEKDGRLSPIEWWKKRKADSKYEPDLLDQFMDSQFHDLEKLRGMTVVYEAENYDEAASFITHLTNDPVHDHEPLSQDPETFIELFDHFADGDTVLQPGREMIGYAIDAGDLDSEIEHYLEQHHPGALKEAMDRELLDL